MKTLRLIPGALLSALIPALITATLPAPAAAGEKPKVNCICKANSQDYHVGDVICLRGVIAQCVMSQNVTSWDVSKAPCPSVEAPVPEPGEPTDLAYANFE
ncbi:hypothetical protein ADZ37_23490 [Pannonibacter phragmitetus]|uniref:hypothetical protein n=1 Tax=Pannonibacter phragmitetus TaxID=121719 RepID=UPI00067C9B89|nr:hypothetical protein [Pannonibacter phragmitetus]KND16386.1 hypothetical protein ADZ37_23490 [Pannonibacter phragmitetus]